MKKISRRAILKLFFGTAAVCGWGLWAMNTYTLNKLERETAQFQELTDVLIHDVRDFKISNQELQTKLGSLMTQEEVTNGDKTRSMRDQVIVKLKEKNRFLQEKLDKMRYAFQKQIRDILNSEWAFDRSDKEKRLASQEALDDAVQLGTLTVTGHGASFESGAPPLPDGRVISVDANQQFVVVNIGRASGIDLGSRFTAMHAQTQVAYLSAIEIRDSLAACDVRCLTPGCEVKIDDAVYLSKKAD